MRFHETRRPAASTPDRAAPPRSPLLRLACLLVLSVVVGPACAGTAASASDGPVPPPLLLGAFEDDYGHRFEITPQSWSQEPGARLVVVEWLDAQRSILARTHPDDRGSEGELWTRIDWVRLDDSAPWTWGFCLVIWDAPTRGAALAAPPADPDRPRIGCNGYPFSRMRPGV